jgi:hypothetical protein
MKLSLEKTKENMLANILFILHLIYFPQEQLTNI